MSDFDFRDRERQAGPAGAGAHPQQPDQGHLPHRTQPVGFAEAPLAEAQPAGPAEPSGEQDPSTDAAAQVQGGLRARRNRVIGFGVAAAMLLTIGAGGGAIATTLLNGSSAIASGSTGAFGQTQPDASDAYGAGPGWGGRGGSGGSGSGASGSGTAGTVATDAQGVGVVTITTTLGYSSGRSAGTGVVLTSDGRILTNNHVIEGATEIEVTDESTDRTYSATVVGTHASDDVAVLQLEGASGLATATIAGSAVSVGDAVVAVGNAGGTGTLYASEGTVTDVEESITAGSGYGDAESLEGLIEVDADVVSGDSGGPLKNAEGEVVGINTAASSGGQDITGYAVPIDDALAIAAQILAGRDTDEITIGYPAFLGVSLIESGPATVEDIIEGTPAEAAGLSAGDTITAVDGRSVGGREQLTEAIRGYEPGDTVTLDVTGADGTSRTVEVTLAQGPAD